MTDSTPFTCTIADLPWREFPGNLWLSYMSGTEYQVYKTRKGKFFYQINSYTVATPCDSIQAGKAICEHHFNDMVRRFLVIKSATPTLLRAYIDERLIACSQRVANDDKDQYSVGCVDSYENVADILTAVGD